MSDLSDDKIALILSSLGLLAHHGSGMNTYSYKNSKMSHTASGILERRDLCLDLMEAVAKRGGKITLSYGQGYFLCVISQEIIGEGQKPLRAIIEACAIFLEGSNYIKQKEHNETTQNTS